MLHWLLISAVIASLAQAQEVSHPLDSLTSDEYKAIATLVGNDERFTEDVRFPLVSLLPPEKSIVKAWNEGDPIPRMATAYLKDGTSAYKVEVDLMADSITSVGPAEGEHMILLEEFFAATETVLQSPEMLAGLEARGITPDQVYCLPLTAGSFGDPQEEGRRLMKVPCTMKPDGSSNWWAKPIEGLFALVDLTSRTVIEVTDTGIVPIASDSFGYTTGELETRGISIRGGSGSVDGGSAVLSAESVLPYSIDGSLISWDIWRFRYRVDKRPGVILSQIEVMDETKSDWRSVLYEAYVSEVFSHIHGQWGVWIRYLHVYFDSGIDCPSTATYLDATYNDDLGMPFDIEDSICIFERKIGDPMWRHLEVENDFKVEGREMKELVVRYASTVGNYDYLVDFIFMPDGTLKFGVGSTGIDAVRGVAATSMDDAGAADETRYGTLIAPNLVGVNHAHYFNYRLDFDLDGTGNSFQKAKLGMTATADLGVDIPRTSMWTVDYETVTSELAARTKIDPSSPSNYYFINPNVESALGHNPGYQIIPSGSYAYSLLDITDWPVRRNAYIDNQLYVSQYHPEEIYAGGEYAFQSDGNDTLHAWTEADRDIENEDIVAWYTVGFHHVPRMEDWPVMPMHWAYFQVRPFNFFPYNPSIGLAETTATGTGIEDDTIEISAGSVWLNSGFMAVLMVVVSFAAL